MYVRVAGGRALAWHERLTGGAGMRIRWVRRLNSYEIAICYEADKNTVEKEEFISIPRQANGQGIVTWGGAGKGAGRTEWRGIMQR